MTNTVQLKGGTAAYNAMNTERGLSPALWADFPISDIQQGLRPGCFFFDDFLTSAFTVPTSEANCGIYKGFSSTGGVMTQSSDSTAANNAFGAIALGSDGDDEGASIATVPLPFKLTGPQATAAARSGKFVFECRVKVSSIADTISDCFIGLMDQATLTATVPITATAGTLADENLVGFHRLGTDGDYWDVKYKADGQTVVTHHSDAQVIVADTYLKLGMIYDPLTTVLSFFGNGLSLGTGYTLVATAGNPFPNDVQMGLVAATLNAAAGSPTFTLDWWAAGQLAA